MPNIFGINRDLLSAVGEPKSKSRLQVCDFSSLQCAKSIFLRLMQFLNPTFLWALAALVLPIIIHLFHFRRFKKVYFTNVHLLKELKEETSTRSRLRSLLILLSRCAALAMLVFAFAQPIIRSSSVIDVRSNAVEIIVDNSFSMEARKAEVPLLTLAKDKAREIILSYKESDTYLILTHDLKAKHLRYVDQSTALNFVEELISTPEVQGLEQMSKVVDRLRNQLIDHNHQLYILSDFQQNISSFDAPLDSVINVTLVPFRAVQESNIAITKASFISPIAMKDQVNELVLEVQNFSLTPQAVELRMNYENQERPLGTIRLGPQSIESDTITLQVTRTGWHEVLFNIEDYPVSFDNQWHLAFNVKDRIDVLNIYERQANTYINTVLGSIEYYDLIQQSKGAIRYENFAQQELIILDDLRQISTGLASELVKYVRSGGNLLIFPSINAELSSYNTLLAQLKSDRLTDRVDGQQEVSRINTDAFIFSDVYEGSRSNLRLPNTEQNYNLTDNSINKERLLSYRSGKPFLQRSQLENGNVYLCSAPLEASISDLVRNAEVFVPMIFKMALSSGVRPPLSYIIGQNDIITLDEKLDLGTERFNMQGPIEFIPSISNVGSVSIVDVRDQIRSAGFYQLKLDEKQISTLAFNYDRQESDVVYGDMGPIAQSISASAEIIDDIALANIGQYITQQKSGTALWRWCLILCLLFLLLETVLIRFWK